MTRWNSLLAPCLKNVSGNLVFVNEPFVIGINIVYCFQGVGKKAGGVSSQLVSPARVPGHHEPHLRERLEGPRGIDIVPDEHERQIREALKRGATYHGRTCGNFKEARERTQRGQFYFKDMLYTNPPVCPVWVLQKNSVFGKTF